MGNEALFPSPNVPIIFHFSMGTRGGGAWNSQVTQAVSVLPTVAKFQIPLRHFMTLGSGINDEKRESAAFHISRSGFGSQLQQDPLGGSGQST